MKKAHCTNIGLIFLLACFFPLAACVTDRAAPKGSSVTTADLDSRENGRKLDKLSEDLDGLTSTLESFQSDIRFLREDLDRLKERMDTLEGGTDGFKAKPEPHRKGDVVSAPPPSVENLGEKAIGEEKTPISESGVQTASLQAEDYYQNAYDDLRFGEYKSAIENFRKFIENHPGHDLNDNAQYWIGESFYGLKEFDKAAEEFKKVYDVYPKGNKVPDAKLKHALCLYDLKEVDRCFAELQKMTKEYSGKKIGETAAKQLERLKKKHRP